MCRADGSGSYGKGLYRIRGVRLRAVQESCEQGGFLKKDGGFRSCYNLRREYSLRTSSKLQGTGI